ncbi:hypothetical protein J3Q64DRAFT_1643326 [Phycomyces blakesleeanus]|uniref:Late embryogenesis abundant protein LEA-2 subgroup domain-containing protein n=1 Tax=Phycomyces blakesleeanus TaxID=4837 RepID=A0ABR3ATW7_PHYBL
MPSIEFQGIAPIESDESIISFNNDKLSINFGLIVNIENRNIFPIYLYDVNAYGYYPYPEDPSTRTSIGDGHLDYELVPSQTNYNFTYPFTIKYDPASDPNLSILGSIADKCGLTGGAKGDLSIQYDIKLRARVLLFTIPLTISSSANFPCPLNVSFKSIGYTDPPIEPTYLSLSLLVGYTSWSGHRFTWTNLWNLLNLSPSQKRKRSIYKGGDHILHFLLYIYIYINYVNCWQCIYTHPFTPIHTHSHSHLY